MLATRVGRPHPSAEPRAPGLQQFRIRSRMDISPSVEVRRTPSTGPSALLLHQTARRGCCRGGHAGIHCVRTSLGRARESEISSAARRSGTRPRTAAASGDADAAGARGFAGVQHIRLQDVLRHAGLTTGAAYRLWADQSDYQRDLAVSMVRLRLSEPTDYARLLSRPSRPTPPVTT